VGREIRGSLQNHNSGNEQRAAGEAAWWEALLGSIGGAIVRQGPDGTICDWNTGAEGLYGYTREEALGRPYSMLLPTEGELADTLLALSRNGAPLEVASARQVAKDGRPLEVALLLAPVRATDGRYLGAWSVAHDLSERKIAAQRQVEFLALLGHELRNPLGAMVSAIGLLELPAVAEETAREALQILKRQGRHLSRLVDDLLELSRLTRGRIELRRRSIDLAEAVELSVKGVRSAIEERRHRLWVSLPPEPVRIEVDPDRFEQILGNLLRNAAIFTEPGGEIWVCAERAGDQALVRVRDSGIGIEPELLPRIFEPFIQGDRHPADPHGSLGIGLTMVRRLVELQGGSVEAHSDGPGRGSELVVTLPALPAGEGAIATSARPAAASEATRRRLLLVDDHRDAAKALAELLASLGHQVEVAFDGLEAIGAALTSKPEIVLLDLGLPGMDGYDVARRLRQEPALTDALLVAVTGYGHEEARERSRAAGFDLHLVKPVDPQVLQELLGAWTPGEPPPALRNQPG
jgi:PAS domain S-box-containing protein